MEKLYVTHGEEILFFDIRNACEMNPIALSTNGVPFKPTDRKKSFRKQEARCLSGLLLLNVQILFIPTFLIFSNNIKNLRWLVPNYDRKTDDSHYDSGAFTKSEID